MKIEETKIFEDYPDILNVNQLCQALDCGKNTAYNLINQGNIKALKIGNTWKIPKAYLIQYIKIGDSSKFS